MAETKTIQEILLKLGEDPINLNVTIPGVQGKDGERPQRRRWPKRL